MEKTCTGTVKMVILRLEANNNCTGTVKTVISVRKVLLYVSLTLSFLFRKKIYRQMNRRERVHRHGNNSNSRVGSE